MRVSRVVAGAVPVVAAIVVAVGACRSRTTRVAETPPSDPEPSAASRGPGAEPAVVTPTRWQIERFLVETGPPPGWVVSFVRAGWTPRVAFADPAGSEGGRSTVELREECHHCEADAPADKIERGQRDARDLPGARWERDREQVADGVWASRVRHDGGTRIVVAHVVPGLGPFLLCRADVEPSADAQVATIERFCTTLSYRVEASGVPIEHAFGGRYELRDLEVVVPPSWSWSFSEYQRWPAALRFERPASPIGYTAQLRFLPQRLGPQGLEGDVDDAAESDATRTPRVEWIQRATERPPGIWSYSLRLFDDRVETVVIEVAGARGKDALWCRVELRRPEDQAMAAAMQDMCIDRVVAATAR